MVLQIIMLVIAIAFIVIQCMFLGKKKVTWFTIATFLLYRFNRHYSFSTGNYQPNLGWLYKWQSLLFSYC